MRYSVSGEDGGRWEGFGCISNWFGSWLWPQVSMTAGKSLVSILVIPQQFLPLGVAHWLSLKFSELYE